MHKRQPENISIALLFMRSNLLKRQMVKAGSFMSRRMQTGLFGCFYTEKDHEEIDKKAASRKTCEIK